MFLIINDHIISISNIVFMKYEMYPSSHIDQGIVTISLINGVTECIPCVERDTYEEAKLVFSDLSRMKNGR